MTRRRSWGSGRAIGALVLREMSTSYGRVSGGYLWAIAEPVGGIMILAIIFSLGFRNPPIGTNFAIFYATGLVPFLFYSDISQKLSQAIQFSRSLLAYPAVTFMDAILGRLFTNVVTQLLVAYIVFAGITLTMETRTDPQLPEIALSLAMAGVLGLGIGVLNCFLFTGFPWWQKVWMILNRPLMIASCVIFMFDTVPQPWRDWLWWNPLVHVVGQMRKAFYPSYSGDYVSPAYVFGVGLICLTLGLTLLLRYHRDLLNG
nr:ABC transporter permease [Paracoccus albicereus]